MKKLNLLNMISLGIVLGLMGCNKNSSTSKSVTTVPITNVSLPDYLSGGNTGSVNSSSAVITNLVGVHPDLAAAYASLDMELHIGTVIGNHTDLDANQAGDITIHKKHFNGTTSYSYFTSGGNTVDDVKENYWSYNSSGKLVWRGVFEGPTGTLVVVVDGIYESGDGNDPFDYMSGSVWYRPWPVVADTGINSDKCYVKNGRLDCKNPAGPLVRCWDVSLGPYDCRFNVSADSKTVTAIGNEYADEPYTKVADFINLSKERTFKETY
ncbi:MAG: hypothetical protein ACRBBP_10460 [Bdellovibrionales bacterium]